MAEPIPMMRARLVAQHGEERRAVRADADSRGEHGVDGERECHHGDHRHRLQPARLGDRSHPSSPVPRKMPAANPITSSRRASVSISGARPATTCGITPTSMAAATTATTCSAVCVAGSPPDVVSSV